MPLSGSNTPHPRTEIAVKELNAPFTIYAASLECGKVAKAKNDTERDRFYWQANGYISALLLHKLIDIDVHEALRNKLTDSLRAYNLGKGQAPLEGEFIRETQDLEPT